MHGSQAGLTSVHKSPSGVPTPFRRWARRAAAAVALAPMQVSRHTPVSASEVMHGSQAGLLTRLWPKCMLSSTRGDAGQQGKAGSTVAMPPPSPGNIRLRYGSADVFDRADTHAKVVAKLAS